MFIEEITNVSHINIKYFNPNNGDIITKMLSKIIVGFKILGTREN
jgi:hypothetical protein